MFMISYDEKCLSYLAIVKQCIIFMFKAMLLSKTKKPRICLGLLGVTVNKNCKLDDFSGRYKLKSVTSINH